VRKDGVEYFNTDCWNDRYCHYVLVDDRGVRLRRLTEYRETVKEHVNLSVQRLLNFDELIDVFPKRISAVVTLLPRSVDECDLTLFNFL
jgi:hypothetical protein